jgi:hypothetical protein
MVVFIPLGWNAFCASPYINGVGFFSLGEGRLERFPAGYAVVHAIAGIDAA